MAGIDGILNKIDPGDAVDKNIYDLPPEEAAGIPTVPGSLEEALRALEDDHDYLLRGDVFTEDVVQSWLDYKYAERDRPGAPAAAPVGVLLVLRPVESTDRVTEKGPAQAGLFPCRHHLVYYTYRYVS